MKIIDLSREIYHRTPVHPAHPPVIFSVWYDHDEKKSAGATTFSSKLLNISMNDHVATHVDAPLHFDSRPSAAAVHEMALETFYAAGICVSLPDVPFRHAVSVAEVKKALMDSGQEIRPGDVVLFDLGVNKRLWGHAGYLHDFPGLAVETIHWLADIGVKLFGVEAISPAPEGELNYQAHLACAERDITHVEGLANLDQLVGAGPFRFVGFPLRIRGGTASPIRAVAIFE
jgi:kynurenine formamidase